jgi:glycosyltransferase involved in cell wall biosynthesis
MGTRSDLNLLVFDSAYSCASLRERNLEAFVTCRDLNGFFGHVFSINPLTNAELAKTDPDRYGPVEVIKEFAPRHTLIEARVERFRWLQRWTVLNVFLSQVCLFIVLVRMFWRNRISVVRGEDPLLNGGWATLVARLLRRPVLIGVWGNPGSARERSGMPLMRQMFLNSRMEAAWERFILRSADRVMVQNDDNGSYVESCGVPATSIKRFALGNALSPVHRLPPETREDGLPDLQALGVVPERSVLCVARLHKVKMLDHAVLALSELHGRGVAVHLLIAGDGPSRHGLTELIDELELSNSVVFCGNRDQEWLARVIPMVAAVVAPLAGRALAEAALGAAPVVAYDIDWHSDLIESGVTGELVEYMDHVGLADGLQKVIEDPDYGRRVGIALRDRTLRVLDPERVDAEQLSAYQELLSLP